MTGDVARVYAGRMATLLKSVGMLAFALALATATGCKKKAAPEGNTASSKVDDGGVVTIPAVSADAAAAGAPDPCDAVTKHILSIEEKEMAPATFANRDERLQMLRGDCTKHGLAPGEAECILAATSQAMLNSCRPGAGDPEPVKAIDAAGTAPAPAP